MAETPEHDGAAGTAGAQDGPGAASRALIEVHGPDARSFLQGLITNDIGKVDRDGIAYAALLTPQGKYLADFHVVANGPESYLVDVAAFQAEPLMQRLGLYRLRAKVEIRASSRAVATGRGAAPEGALPDPRHPELGWRFYGPGAEGAPAPPTAEDAAAWTALRVALAIPEAGAELGPDSYILEMGFERLNGVDFGKGCYVGQEVTARMKHKASLRKGLARLRLAAPVPPGTEILRAERVVGRVTTVHGTEALGHARFDRVGPGMTAGGVPVLSAEPAI